MTLPAPLLSCGLLVINEQGEVTFSRLAAMKRRCIEHCEQLRSRLFGLRCGLRLPSVLTNQ